MRIETIKKLYFSTLIVMVVVFIASMVWLGCTVSDRIVKTVGELCRMFVQTNYTIYAVDEDGDCRQVENFVLVPSGSITCPNDLKLQQPRYVFVERAEK